MTDPDTMPADGSGEADPNGWRPIETAPKDGTLVLIFAALGNPAAFEGVLLAAYGRTDDNGEDWWALDSGGWVKSPSHWMPLPPPPTDGAK